MISGRAINCCKEDMGTPVLVAARTEISHHRRQYTVGFRRRRRNCRFGYQLAVCNRLAWWQSREGLPNKRHLVSKLVDTLAGTYIRHHCFNDPPRSPSELHLRAQHASNATSIDLEVHRHRHVRRDHVLVPRLGRAHKMRVSELHTILKQKTDQTTTC